MNAVLTPKPWEARLELGFTRVVGLSPAGGAPRTVLSRCRHEGPLRVQKALYPEGPGICHAVILHPPAGIAGGDTLDVSIRLGAHAQAAISTPSATRWYKSNGGIARQTTHIELGPDARLDWLPQENLFFDAARAEVSFSLAADASAAAIGWDATMLGRRASGEMFGNGELRLASRIERGGTSLWREQGQLSGSDRSLSSPIGLAGRPVMATLWALGAACTGSLAESLAPHLPWSEQLRAGSTALPGGLLLVRVLGTHMEPVRCLLEGLWTQLRPIVLGTAAQPLRLWTS